MRAEIISVGTELLLGSVVNTDSADISRMLSEIGVDVFYHTVVGDNPDRLAGTIELAKSRSDLIITTGGLGPTCDDLTKSSLAAAFGKKLVYNEEAAEVIRRYFADRLPGAEITENNYLQAYLPEGCVPFQNSCGTAPGCAFEADGVRVIMLPGPPRECRAMFRISAMPYLASLSGEHIFSRYIRVFGIGESKLDSMTRDIMEGLTNPTLAPYAGNCECMLRLTAKAENESAAELLMEPVLRKVRSVLGDCIYTDEYSSLEETALSLLRERGLTLAASESFTGGLFSKRVTDLPGSEEVFLGSAVLPSSEDSESMAKSARSLFSASLGIGIAESEGFVFVSLADKESVFTRKLSLGSDRARARHSAASHALDMLRRFLTGKSVI